MFLDSNQHSHRDRLSSQSYHKDHKVVILPRGYDVIVSQSERQTRRARMGSFVTALLITVLENQKHSMMRANRVDND